VPIDPAIVAIVAFSLVGLGAGMLLGRRSSEGAARARALETELDVERTARERVIEEKRAMEEELARARAEAAEYRGRVVEHFYGTSEQLRALTTQYRAVYEHLAEGAQALCPETFQALRASLEVPALEGGAERPADAHAEAPEESAPA
jgi:uncharacterized membrane-anchored protein YhcB (DUF1043 family)